MARRFKKKLYEFIFVIIILFVCIDALVNKFKNFSSYNIFSGIKNNLDVIIISLVVSFILNIFSKRINSTEYFKRIEYINKSVTVDSILRRFKNTPLEFEHYIANVFRMMGYTTYVTKGSGDGGKDIIMNKGGLKYAVEVKLYSKHNSISREKIQKLHSAMIDIKADKAIFVTTSYYTKPAFEYAKKHKIDIINGNDLVILIRDTLKDSNKKVDINIPT